MSDAKEALGPNIPKQPNDYHSLFAAAWPEVERRIHARLAYKGCGRTDQADIAQDIAERLLRREIPFTDAADLYRYAVAAASNAWIDLATNTQLRAGIEAGHDIADFDLATTVELRHALQLLLPHLTALPRHRRALLLEEPTPSGDRQNDIRINVQRHRLRTKLRLIVAGLFAAASLISTSVPLAVAAHQHSEARNSPRGLLRNATRRLIQES